MKNKTTAYIIGLIVIAIGLAVVLSYFNRESDTGPGQYDQFASCIKDSGATFYGAFWCTHCRDQKKLFGNSAKLLPYQECSTPNASGQLQACIDKKIESYPTWIFKDGTRESKVFTLEELAVKTSCSITGTVSTTTASTTTK